MRELYTCPDGRLVLLRLDEDSLLDQDTLSVFATTPEGEHIGRFKFELVDENGEILSLTEDAEGTTLLKLAEDELPEAWHGQGITERAVNLMADEISVSPVDSLLRKG